MGFFIRWTTNEVVGGEQSLIEGQRQLEKGKWMRGEGGVSPMGPSGPKNMVLTATVRNGTTSTQRVEDTRDREGARAIDWRS